MTLFEAKRELIKDPSKIAKRNIWHGKCIYFESLHNILREYTESEVIKSIIDSGQTVVAESQFNVLIFNENAILVSSIDSQIYISQRDIIADDWIITTITEVRD